MPSREKRKPRRKSQKLGNYYQNTNKETWPKKKRREED